MEINQKVFPIHERIVRACSVKKTPCMGICISLWNMRCKCKWDSVSIYNGFFWYNGVLVESVQDYGGSFDATEYLSTDIFVVSMGNLLTNGLPKNHSWWWIIAGIWRLTAKGVHSITEILFQHCVIYIMYMLAYILQRSSIIYTTLITP